MLYMKGPGSLCGPVFAQGEKKAMMKKRFSLFLITVLAVSMMNVTGFAKTENMLYVAPDGSDSAAGTSAAPLATFEGAKEKAKGLAGPVTVYFRAGSYTFDGTVAFTADDKADVTYAAYPGEAVTFTAGTPYTGFEESTVNGVRAFRKDVGDADFNVLFSAERALPRPRYPEEGYLSVKSVSDKDVVNPEQEEDVHRGYTAMTANAKDLPALKYPADVIVRILHYWKDEMVTAASYDRAAGRIGFSRPTSMQIREGDRFFFENVFEALNAPGEWYLDRSEGALWYIPFEGEKAEDLTLWGSDVETVISVDGVNGVVFENIVFRGNGFRIPRGNRERDLSSQAAYDATPCVSFEHTEGSRVTNCEFRDIAACAVYFGSAVKNARVENCCFENIGAQAVFIRGENVPLEDENVTKDITVTNNYISGYGREFFNAVGVLVIHANSVEVSHNEISDGYYTAISCGWVWGYAYNVTNHCRITDNLIYNIGQGWLSDMGGIYMLGVQPGTVLSGNVIHNVAADPGQGGYGGWGVYLDEGSSEMTVEKNLVYACGSDSYHLHYGADNVIRNNIFALSAESQIRVVSRFEEHKTADFTNNVILTDGRTPAFSHMADAAAFTAENNWLWDVSNGGKIYVTKDGDYKKAMSLATAQRKRLIGENTVIDPQFADPLQFDFALDENSPAVLGGFETWDYAAAGTLAGTVLGTGREGGTTPYNAHSAAQTMRGSRVLFPLLKEFINRLVLLFRRFVALFGKSR